ncbi:hypothetical protein GLW20_00350, partial [Virgibacillus halodenitrificans]|nr:hypothetical protein [Virgibacillus halodenitrificans]
FALVLGDNEIEENAVNVRRYGEKNSETIAYDEFETLINKEIDKKILNKR